MLVQLLRGLCQLPADPVDPARVEQPRVALPGHFGQVDRAGEFAGDQRAAVEGASTALLTPTHHRCSRDAPLGEVPQVLPLGLDPRTAEPAAQPFARGRVALDVVAHTTVLHTQHFGQRIAGDPVALEGEYPVEVAEEPGGFRIQPLGQFPSTQAPSPPAYLRS
ncbi:hypothetical protein D3C81_1810710 [compost metagenome]